MVWGVQTSEGWIDDPEKIKDHFFDFFKDNFDSTKVGGPTLGATNFSKITSEEAAYLERPFEEEEVWDAIKNCGGNKSPGPDGFTVGFLKKFWGIIKGDLIGAFSWFWEKGEIGDECNSSFLTLIPKTNAPLHLGDYRPISLIGVLYKILAKMLAERIKGVMGRIINDSQKRFHKRKIHFGWGVNCK